MRGEMRDELTKENLKTLLYHLIEQINLLENNK